MSIEQNELLFLNRELGLIEFNRRVLAQAEDPSLPLLERLRYLCIVSSNLDEFFEVRFAGIREQIKLGNLSAGLDGIAPKQAYKLITDRAHQLVDHQYQLFNHHITPALAQQNIRFARRTHWNEAQREWVRDYFFREVMPVLTPIGLDPAHPFPRVLNKSLNFVVELHGKNAFGRPAHYAIVQAPRVLPRTILMPKEISTCEYSFVFLSSILHAHVGELFPGMNIQGCYQFRVTRNSDLFVDEEEIKNLRQSLQCELPQRHFGDAVRLEVAENCPDHLSHMLLKEFELQADDLYSVKGPVNLVRLMEILNKVERDDLKFSAFKPGLPEVLQKKNDDIFSCIRKGDILLHHPFQSFQPVIDFVQQAALDPDVVAIKQTVYRTGGDSALMEALISAAQRGKEVTVVVELLARFDEEANINWATRLEKVGAHIVYGVVGYKTHAKMLMVVRREQGVLRRYIHIGTGNYHPRTARLYTDFGLFSAHESLCEDIHQVFSQLTSLSQTKPHHHVFQSPFSLHNNIIKAIDAEIEHVQKGRPAAIMAKMNSLLEPQVIQALYRASQAGVKIDLIVRGVCALRPGVKGLSENIRVRSIIGRFLEHSRIFYFCNNMKHDVYLSSADWMERNFFRRVEICVPILDKKLKKIIMEDGLKIYFADNKQTWEMDQQGLYHRKKVRPNTTPTCAQCQLLVKLSV